MASVNKPMISLFFNEKAIILFIIYTISFRTMLKITEKLNIYHFWGISTVLLFYI